MALGLKYEFERSLSPFAARSEHSKGRAKPISPDPARTEYERDYHRILYSLAFRRLRHKTQVFYAPKNDHICTRMDHSLQVASISDTLCRLLNINADLANAIALGHDLGHGPFGHTGEEVLSNLCHEKGLGDFLHEAHSLRIVDTMKELHGETLNLTYEVRDGIVCHCGEIFDHTLMPDRQKDVTQVDASAAREQRPYTLEGCVVRYADRIAYLAADLQDALELKIIRKKDIPQSVKMHLGTDTGEIIGKVTEDIYTLSRGNDYIATSKTIFDSMEELHRFSIERIYNCDLIVSWKHRAQKIIRDMFDEFHAVLMVTRNGKDKRSRSQYKTEAHRVFFQFIDSMKYDQNERPEQIVLDFVTGMTDNFALKCFAEIFLEVP